MRATLADDDGQLRFMLHALRKLGEHDGIFGTDKGRGGLKEHKRFLGDFVAHFSGMSGIVAADANNFRGFHGSHQANVSQRPRARSAGPLSPRSSFYLLDMPAFEQAIEGQVLRSGGTVAEDEAAKFHF